MIEATMSLPRLLVLAVIGLAHTVALAELLPACSAQPFDDESAAQYEQRLVRTCGGEHAQWKLETARARPLDPGPSLLNAQFSTVATRTLDAWRGTLQMDWAGTRSETAGSRTARAMLGASSLLRLQDWALHVKFGHQMVGDLSTRATVTSVWQPSRSALVFAEWAGVQIGSLPSDRAQRVGARWWPVPGLMALDVVARHLPNGPGWVDQRLALTLQFKH